MTKKERLRKRSELRVLRTAITNLDKIIKLAKMYGISSYCDPEELKEAFDAQCVALEISSGNVRAGRE